MKDEWFYLNTANNTRNGPVSLSAIADMLKSKSLGTADLVRNCERGPWIPAGQAITLHNSVQSSVQADLSYSLLPPAALAALIHTRPWIILCAVVSCIAASGFFLIILTGIGTAPDSTIEIHFQMNWAPANFTALVLACTCIFAAIFLIRFALEIRLLARDNSSASLVAALQASARFWLTVGVTILFLLVLFLCVAAFEFIFR